MIGKHGGGGGGGGRGRGGRGGWGGGRGGGRTIVLGNWPTYRRSWPGYGYPGGYYQMLLAQQAAAQAAALAAAQQAAAVDMTDNEVREAYINWQRAVQIGADPATVATLKQQLDMLVFGAQQDDQPSTGAAVSSAVMMAMSDYEAAVRRGMPRPVQRALYRRWVSAAAAEGWVLPAEPPLYPWHPWQVPTPGGAPIRRIGPPRSFPGFAG